jgi:hypothetical protein
MLAECANFLESIRPEQEFVASEKPYPDSALHENTIEEIKTKLLEARKLQHLYPQFSEQEMAHLNFVDEATAVIQFKQLDELSDKTLKSYADKAKESAKDLSDKAMDHAKNKDTYNMRKTTMKLSDRIKAARMAVSKMTESAFTHEELDEMTDEDFEDLVENYEQLDELSKNTLASYVKKSADKAMMHSFDAGANAKHGIGSPEFKKHSEKGIKRYSGILKATRKLTKEETEQLDELSKSTLGSYVKKAHDSATGLATTAMHHKNTADLHNQTGNLKRTKEFDRYSFDATEKQIKRTKGVNRAVGKLTKEDLDIVASIEEMFTLSEAVKDHAVPLMKSGKYDPAVRGSGARFKEALKATGATTSDTTANAAWTAHKHLHPKPTQKPKFNQHDPKTWPDGYSHKGNPVHLD